MVFTKIKSYAKINLALNITGKSLSLHKIETIVAFIDLYDVIKIRRIKSNNHQISFDGKFSKNIGKNNTVLKLLKILKNKNFLKKDKFQIKINKKIPSSAGMGGGSMNAANILKYFVEKKIIKASKAEIIKISKLIGSDVIFGLKSTYSILTSANKIKYFPNCKKIQILVVKPNFGCSTKGIYSKVRKFSKPKIKKPNKNMFNLNYLKKMDNSLEQIALSKYSILKTIKSDLENLSKPVFVRMTGSGSAFVAYFQSKNRCERAKKMFKKKYKNYWCIASKTI